MSGARGEGSWDSKSVAEEQRRYDFVRARVSWVLRVLERAGEVD